jgi:hypothetical protein
MLRGRCEQEDDRGAASPPAMRVRVQAAVPDKSFPVMTIVKIRLSNKNRRLIRRLRKVSVLSKIYARGRDGNVQTAGRVLWLKATSMRTRPNKSAGFDQ